MECPVCQESMVVIEYDEIELDYCVGCMGVWFDGGEIELLLEKAGLPVPADGLPFTKTDAPARELKRPCPICGKVMEKVSPPGGDVVLDRCAGEDGIWFDSGEIASAVRASTGSAGEIVIKILGGFLGKALTE